MPRRLSEADSSEQAPGAFGFPCCGPAPFANYPFDIIDIGSQVESRQPFQSPEVGLTQSLKGWTCPERLRVVVRRADHERPLCGEIEGSDVLKELPKFSLGSYAHSSIRVQEGHRQKLSAI